MEFVVSAGELMVGMITFRFLIAAVAWLRSRRILRAASRTRHAVSAQSPIRVEALSAVPP